MLDTIPGYNGDQLKVFCTQDAQQTYGTGELNTDILAGDLCLYFSDKQKRIAVKIVDELKA